MLRWEAVGRVWREWLAWRELCPTRVLVSSCYPARSLGWIVRALSSSLRYDANRDNQKKLTANVGSDRNSQSIPWKSISGAPRHRRAVDNRVAVFWNGARSGPNCTLFSDADRLADALWDRSGVGWSPTPHAAVLGALQRALDRNLWQIMVQSNGAQRTLLICMHRWKPPRVRCRRLHVYSIDPMWPQGDLRAMN